MTDPTPPPKEPEEPNPFADEPMAGADVPPPQDNGFYEKPLEEPRDQAQDAPGSRPPTSGGGVTPPTVIILPETPIDLKVPASGPLNLDHLLDSLHTAPERLTSQEALILAAALPSQFEQFYARLAQTAKPFIEGGSSLAPVQALRLYFHQTPSCALEDRLTDIDTQLEIDLKEVPPLPRQLAKLQLAHYFFSESDRKKAHELFLQKLYEPGGVLAKSFVELALPSNLQESRNPITKGLERIAPLFTSGVQNLAILAMEGVTILDKNTHQELSTLLAYTPTSPEDFFEYTERVMTYLTQFEERVPNQVHIKLTEYEHSLDLLMKKMAEQAGSLSEEHYLRTARFMDVKDKVLALRKIEHPSEPEKAELAILLPEFNALYLAVLCIPQLKEDSETFLSVVKAMKERVHAVVEYVLPNLSLPDEEPSSDLAYQQPVIELRRQLATTIGISLEDLKVSDPERATYQALFRGEPLQTHQVYALVTGSLEGRVATAKARHEGAQALLALQRAANDERTRHATEKDEKNEVIVALKKAVQDYTTQVTDLLRAVKAQSGVNPTDPTVVSYLSSDSPVLEGYLTSEPEAGSLPREEPTPALSPLLGISGTAEPEAPCEEEAGSQSSPSLGYILGLALKALRHPSTLLDGSWYPSDEGDGA